MNGNEWLCPGTECTLLTCVTKKRYCSWIKRSFCFHQTSSAVIQWRTIKKRWGLPHSLGYSPLTLHTINYYTEFFSQYNNALLDPTWKFVISWFWFHFWRRFFFLVSGLVKSLKLNSPAQGGTKRIVRHWIKPCSFLQLPLAIDVVYRSNGSSTILILTLLVTGRSGLVHGCRRLRRRIPHRLHAHHFLSEVDQQVLVRPQFETNNICLHHQLIK